MKIPASWLRHAPVRRGLRKLRRRLSIGKYHLQVWKNRDRTSRIITRFRTSVSAEIEHPAIRIWSTNGQVERAYLESQTETSRCLPDEPGSPAFLYLDTGDLDKFPATHLESLVLALAAEPLAYAISSYAKPPSDPDRWALELDPKIEGIATTLFRSDERTDRDPRSPARVLGRFVAHTTSERPFHPSLDVAGTHPLGPYLLREDQPDGELIDLPWHEVHRVLRGLPTTPGPPTVLFLLPYLAVGGAERLLFQLLQSLNRPHRALIVTLEPHLESRGTTLDEARKLTPYVYNLGEWLPREARMSAVKHLLRRYEVRTLFCWNGASDFYDQLPILREEFPTLRILNQLFNHEGGWMDHYSRSVVDAVDLHVSINSRITSALAKRWNVPSKKLTEVQHAIDLPALRTGAERDQLRRERRKELGLPVDSLVVGSFCRLHPQKRPFDVLALARVLNAQNVYFILVGGGPLDEAIDSELRDRPIPNLLRLPMQRDPSPLFDALDLCLLTSEYEGLPVFLLEGLARNLPFVAPAVGDIPDLCVGGAGRTVERPGDLVGLTREILFYQDPRQREIAGGTGRSRVEQSYSLERYTAEYSEAIFPKGESR